MWPRVHTVPSRFSLLLIGSLLSAPFVGCTSGTTTTAPAGPTPTATAPQVTTQPADKSVSVGDTATFSVIASGSPPLSFDWRKNGTSLGAPSSSSYTTPTLAAADDGSTYTVVVSNSAGSVTSSSAKLSVSVKAPQITQNPQSITVSSGTSATFSVVAAGSAPLTYQWLLNALPVTGATSSTYTVASPTVADTGGQYSVTVSNSAGSVTSSAATLTVTSGPVSVVTQPDSVTRFAGEMATFTVAAAGDSPSFQWRKNGVAIDGAASPSYTTAALTSSDDQSKFDVVVSNSVSSVSSSVATLSVAPFATTYHSISAGALNLFAWPGSKLAILTASNSIDPVTMRHFSNVMDSIYNYYHDAVGKEPYLYVQYNGLGTVAEVPSTCGAGCTYIGATGMEMIDPYFTNAMNEAAKNQIDQVPAYEMGRSFWLFHDQLEYIAPDSSSCIVTGFAVLMRYEAIDGIGLPGVYDTVDNYKSMLAGTKTLVDSYEADTSLNWDNSILSGNYRNGAYGCSDLFASMAMRIGDTYGGEQTFMHALWKEALKRPKAITTQDAVDNFILAASADANHNLTALFQDKWRWPVSTAAANEATQRFGKP